MARYQESLALFGELDQEAEVPEALVWLRRSLGHAAYVSGDNDRARELLGTSLRYFSERREPERGVIALVLVDVAGMLGRRGDAVGAAELFGAAQAVRGPVATAT